MQDPEVSIFCEVTLPFGAYAVANQNKFPAADPIATLVGRIQLSNVTVRVIGPIETTANAPSGAYCAPVIK